LRAPKSNTTWLVLAAWLTSVPMLHAQKAAAPDLAQIVSRMEQAREQAKQTAPFLLKREYRLFHGDEVQPTSEVKAEISVVPPHDRDYKIVASKGSGRGEKVVRKILEHEAAAEKSSPPPTAVVPKNYDFSLLGEETFQGAHCYVLGLHPKREDPSLVEGRAWVDAQSFLLRKVEGEMSKSPSWWVKQVKVTLLFGEIGGIWTQISTNAVADVRIVGQYTVTGEATDLEQSEAVAANRLPKRPANRIHRALPAEVLPPGVVVPRKW